MATPCAIPIRAVAGSTTAAGRREIDFGKTKVSGESGVPSFVTPARRRRDPTTEPSEVNDEATTLPVLVAWNRKLAEADSPGGMSPRGAAGSVPGAASREIAPVTEAASIDSLTWFARTVEVLTTVARISYSSPSRTTSG